MHDDDDLPMRGSDLLLVVARVVVLWSFVGLAVMWIRA